MSLNYNDYAVATAPSSSIGSADTSIDVSDNTAYPSPPFLIDVFEGGSSPNDAVKQGGTVERMRVTAKSGTGPYTWTVDRDYNGYNGSAQSFTTSATVWHVQPANAMGPNRSVVQGQIAKSSSRLLLSEDFTSGVPSGWTVQAGSWSVNNGALQPGTSGQQIITTGVTPSNYSGSVLVTGKNRDGTFGVVYSFTDTSNFYWLGFGSSNSEVRIVEVSSGSSTVLNGARPIRQNSVSMPLHFSSGGVLTTINFPDGPEDNTVTAPYDIGLYSDGSVAVSFEYINIYEG